jgi:prepilin peptidase CpaA
MTISSIAAVSIAAVACVVDLRTRRIPNALTFGGAAAALVYRLATGGASGAADGVGGWFVGLALLLIPYALGGMGAGDVKLLAALGAWLGPADTLWLGIYTNVAAGLMALAVAIAHGYVREAWNNVWLLLSHWRVVGLRPLPELTLAASHGPRLAYAAPILVGMVATLCLR